MAKTNHRLFVKPYCDQFLSRMHEIEEESFVGDMRWTKNDLRRMAVSKAHITRVVCRDTLCKRIAGFVVCHFDRESMFILDIVVKEEERRNGVGTLMVDWIKSRLTKGRRKKIVVGVHTDLLPAQLFFRTNGFLAVGGTQKMPPDDSHKKNFDTSFEWYTMVYEKKAKQPILHNRLVKYGLSNEGDMHGTSDV